MRYLLNTDSINAIDKIKRKLWMLRTTNIWNIWLYKTKLLKWKLS